MENMEQIRRHFAFTATDQENLSKLGEILLPLTQQFATDFYDYLAENPETASYFKTDKAVQRRKETFTDWFHDLFSCKYDNKLLRKLERIGKVHVDIGLKGFQVNAAMNYVREMCRLQVAAQIQDGAFSEELLTTMHKALDINLSIITQSFQEAKMKKVFVSKTVESHLVQWSERLLHGLNLVLLIGLLIMAIGVVVLLCVDIYSAFTGDFDHGVIKALGALLILWMMIELLHTEIDHLQGGKFSVRIFVELALVAFIRKIFVASFEYKEPITFALLLASLLVLGVIYFFVAKMEKR